MINVYPTHWQGDPQDETQEQLDPDAESRLQEAIMKIPGCFIMSRTVCRKRTTKSEFVIRAMRAMTHPQGHHRHVGEYRKIGAMQHIFFKCPPDLLHRDALLRYRIDHEQYSALFFSDPRPEKGAPCKWDQYVEGLIRNFPYNPQKFPLHVMGMDDCSLKTLAMFASGVARYRLGLLHDHDETIHDDDGQGSSSNGMEPRHLNTADSPINNSYKPMNMMEEMNARYFSSDHNLTTDITQSCQDDTAVK